MLGEFLLLPARLLALAALLVSATAIVPPAQQGLPNQTPDPVILPTPDNDLIAQTANQVNQKTAPPVDAAPDASVPPTGVTAAGDSDGTVTVAGFTLMYTRALSARSTRYTNRGHARFCLNVFSVDLVISQALNSKVRHCLRREVFEGMTSWVCKTDWPMTYDLLGRLDHFMVLNLIFRDSEVGVKG
ncbi:hypothetical protein K438DRAFT_1944211 [Mycena galopus ATCC 62051]|nr:hypothetical protein K438DRAFT_1944211 [Mycena galopus ATCC 62051]